VLRFEICPPKGGYSHSREPGWHLYLDAGRFVHIEHVWPREQRMIDPYLLFPGLPPAGLSPSQLSKEHSIEFERSFFQSKIDDDEEARKKWDASGWFYRAMNHRPSPGWDEERIAKLPPKDRWFKEVKYRIRFDPCEWSEANVCLSAEQDQLPPVTNFWRVKVNHLTFFLVFYDVIYPDSDSDTATIWRLFPGLPQPEDRRLGESRHFRMAIEKI
jgi:hypothetical protein